MAAATICRRYYVDGDSKSEIAAALGMSRFQVARILEYAVQNGIIQFQIRGPENFDTELSERVRRAYHLRRAIVVDVPDRDRTPANIRQQVGKAAAAVLTETVTADDILGIGWGRTLSAMARSLTEIAGCTVVQMGGMIGSVHDNSMELVRQISAVGRGQAFPLYVPLILQDAGAAASLRNQPGVAQAFRLFDAVTVGAVAIGSWEPPDSQLLAGLSRTDRSTLSNRGIVGEVCSALLREDGSAVSDLEARSMAVTMAQLRRINELLLVAGGAHKARAVRAAILAGLGTTLVTDDSLATALLELARGDEPNGLVPSRHAARLASDRRE